MKKRSIFLLWLLALTALLVPDLWQHLSEKADLDAVAEEISGSLPPEAVPHRLQQAVAARVPWVVVGREYNASSRSFLRQSAWQTWSGQEGTCGDGARLLVQLLRSRGYRASRINLARDGSTFGHTAVVYELDGTWYFLDSIGATPDFQAWATANAKRPFSEIVSFHSDGAGGGFFRSNNPYFTRFSYLDATRFTGGAFLINLVIPPSDALVALIESPPLMRVLLKIIIGLLLLPFVVAGAHLFARWKSHRRAVALAPPTQHKDAEEGFAPPDSERGQIS